MLPPVYGGLPVLCHLVSFNRLQLYQSHTWKVEKKGSIEVPLVGEAQRMESQPIFRPLCLPNQWWDGISVAT